MNVFKALYGFLNMLIIFLVHTRVNSNALLDKVGNNTRVGWDGMVGGEEEREGNIA